MEVLANTNIDTKASFAYIETARVEEHNVID